MSDGTLLSRVQEFARDAHRSIIATTITGVKRPQIVHLQEVADLVWASGGTDEEIAAAWLHDSVEDTSTTLEDIGKKFGKAVSEMVRGLTDADEHKDLPITERKGHQAKRIRNEDEKVRRIKLADQTSNVHFLAIDPTNSMTEQECYDYIHAAKLIADGCRGVSPLLDNLFDEAYARAVERYGRN